jgi:hypothetical protein
MRVINTTPKLKAFLTKEKLLTKFENNVSSIDLHWAEGNLFYNIETAFVWEHTPEGDKFWRGIYHKFEAFNHEKES